MKRPNWKLIGAGILMLALQSIAHAHAFAIKLVPPVSPKDNRPFIEINGVKFVVDTGANHTAIGADVAGGLGIDPGTGVPGKAAVAGGGTIDTAKGAKIPSDKFQPSGPSAPKVPEGQAEKMPPMPEKGDVVPPMKTNGGGMIGYDWLSNFSFGFVTRPSGDSYLYMSTKAQGDEGLKKALNLALTLAYGDPVLPDPDGRPFGTLASVITRTPDFTLPPGVDQYDGGFDLDIDVHGATGDVTGVPFLIKSGLPTTLLSMSTALALGLNLSGLPIGEVDGGFGPFPVKLATLDFHLFNNPAFPVLNASVGVLSDDQNPLNLNYLGSDLLGQLPFWEISSDDAGVTRFYAAAAVTAVPEPSAFGLMAAGVLAMGVIAGRRRNARR